MKRRTKWVLLIIACVAVVVPLAAYGFIVSGITIPSVDVQKIEFQSLDLTTATIRFLVQLNMINQNFFDAHLNFLSLEVYFNGAFAGIIFQEVGRGIPAYSNASFPVEFILCNAPTLTQDVIVVTVEGVANVDVYTINECVPVKETEEVNIRKEFNQAPNALIRDDAAFFTLAGREIRFDGGFSSDPDGEIVKYEWDFGDGTPKQTGEVIGHAYTAAGDYTVTLAVYDNWNAIGTDTTILRIIGMGASGERDTTAVSSAPPIFFGAS